MRGRVWCVGPFDLNWKKWQNDTGRTWLLLVDGSGGASPNAPAGPTTGGSSLPAAAAAEAASPPAS